MRTIALYNRQGQRLLTLREAEQKGHGSVEALKQRIRRGQLPAYKVGQVWLVPEKALPRPVRRRAPRRGQRRRQRIS
jgi:hypothetical protein